MPRVATNRVVQQTTSRALTAYDGVKAGLDVRQAVKDLPAAKRALQTKGVRKATVDAWEQASKDARNPTGALTRAGKAKIAATGFDLVRGVTQLPGQVGTASANVRQAARTGSRQDISNAVQSVATAGSTAANVVGDGLTTGQTANKLITSYRYGRDAFVAAAPKASPALARAAGRAAATQAFEGATRAAAVGATRGAVKSAATRLGSSAGQAVLKTAGREAAEAALKGGARAVTSTLGKAAGRFVPGVNVAIAAFDTANAAATWADPRAPLARKLGNSVTALGSIASATNIPIVSQVGAGVSALSGFVTSFF